MDLTLMVTDQAMSMNRTKENLKFNHLGEGDKLAFFNLQVAKQ